MENLSLTNPERRLLSKMQGTSNHWTVQQVLSACEWNDPAIAVGAGEGFAKLQCKSEKMELKQLRMVCLNQGYGVGFVRAKRLRCLVYLKILRGQRQDQELVC